LTADQAAVLNFRKSGDSLHLHAALRVQHQQHCPKFETNIGLVSSTRCECTSVRLFIDDEGGTSEWQGKQ